MTLDALDLEPFGFLPLAGGGGSSGGDDGGDDGSGDASGDGGGPSGSDDGGPSSDPSDGNNGISGGRSAGRGGPTAAEVDAMNAIGVHSGTEQDFADALGKASSTALSGRAAQAALGLLGAMTPGLTGTAIGLGTKAGKNNPYGATLADVFSQSTPEGIAAMAEALGIDPAAVEAAMDAHNEAAGLNADQQPSHEPGGDDFSGTSRSAAGGAVPRPGGGGEPTSQFSPGLKAPAPGTQPGDYDMGGLDEPWGQSSTGGGLLGSILGGRQASGGTGGDDLSGAFTASAAGGDLMQAMTGPDSTEARNAFRQLQGIDDSRSRGLFDESAGISRAMWDDWSAHGRTTLATLGDELKERSTEAHAARAAGLAASDVNQAFDTETANLRRDLQRYGIDPTSGRAMAGLRGLSLGRSGALAGAQTRTRMAEEQRLFNDRLNFVNTLDNSGKLAGAAAAGLSDAARGHAGLDAAQASRLAASGQGLAGIDASIRNTMLGDLNARRSLQSSREARSLADLNARRDLMSSREARSLADLNARRDMKINLEDLAFRERASLRGSADSRYAADKGVSIANSQANAQKSAAKWSAGGTLIGGFLGGLFS